MQGAVLRSESADARLQSAAIRALSADLPSLARDSGLSVEELLHLLVKARTPEAVAKVLEARTTGLSRETLPKTIARYLGRERSIRPAIAQRDTAPRVARASTTLQTTTPAVADDSGVDEILRLARKLHHLVNLVSVEHRGEEARRQARLAEDSSEARAEGSAPAAGGPNSEQSSEDVSAFTKAVFEKVRQALNDQDSRSMGASGNW